MSNGDRWGNKCALVSETETENSLHRPQKTLKTEKTVFCKVVGVRQNEFYQASAQGYKVELQLEIRKINYASAITHIRYRGCIYRILRTAPAKCAENLMLVCVDKANEARI